MVWEGQEKRRYPRARFLCRMTVISPKRLLVSHTENIGEGGVRVILEEKLGVRTTVGLEVFVEKERPIKSKGRVVWVAESLNPIEGKPLLFDTGIEFIEMDDAARQYISKLVDSILAQEKNKEE